MLNSLRSTRSDKNFSHNSSGKRKSNLQVGGAELWALQQDICAYQRQTTEHTNDASREQAFSIAIQPRQWVPLIQEALICALG